MLLNEIFGKMPLFENSATVQMVVTHIRDMIPDVRAIWLHRKSTRAPWRFIATVSDQIVGDDLLALKQEVKRITNAIQGIEMEIILVIESAFEQPVGAIKVYARPPVGMATSNDR